MRRFAGFKLLVLAALTAGVADLAYGQVVPGTGRKIAEVGDDFEDEKWNYIMNFPKASANIDHIDRQPAGGSTNGRWIESLYRGEMDIIKRVETPEGGLPGSKGAMLMKTLHSGIPGTYSYKMQQDDLLVNCSARLGYSLPAGWSPNCVVRVYLPPFEEWEKRSGSSFGFRLDVEGSKETQGFGGMFRRNSFFGRKTEAYWPGFFIQFNSKTDGVNKVDSAMLLIRGDHLGHEVPGPMIMKPGWWTLGMSVTPDGRVHYYAHAGVEKLTAKDHIYSQWPYGFQCERMHTFFFNVTNQDDGRSWSTPWIVDDPALYVIDTIASR